jgi:mannitol-1-/sugar-/sorbitol-6-/2-deoxyglucose-6-phosphatase
MPIEAVIFDMDGVIVDSEGYWLKAREEFAHARGKQWTDDDQRSVMGRSTIEWARIMQERLQLQSMSLDNIIQDTIAQVRAQYDAHMPVRFGAVEAVQYAAAGYRVGLASGSETSLIKYVTRQLGIDKLLEVMVYGDDMERGKPAPDIYLKAAELLGVSPAKCVGIEDSGNGIRSLQAAGMKIIAAPSPGYPLSQELMDLANVVVQSLEEVTPDLFKSLDV